MYKLIIFNLISLPLLISSMPQSEQLALIHTHNPNLAFHQPNSGVHQPNHQSANHFSLPQSHFSRLHQQEIGNLRGSHLLSAASSPHSSIIHTRSPTQDQVNSQFNNQNSFKPITIIRPQLKQPANNNPKRLKQKQQSRRREQHGPHHNHLQSKINWGRCPMLQPSLDEKIKKAQVITKCLEITPVPENITRETIELHRELVAACALREEGWFASPLLSDENVSKINVSNPNNSSKMLLPTNLTTTSIDLLSNNTLKETNSSKNTSNENFDSKMAYESLKIKEIYSNDTKLDHHKNNKTMDLLSTNSTVPKSDKLNNQTSENLNVDKHSALESDDYAEEDLTGYSAIFTGQVTYNYAKAEHEIRAKKFDLDVEEKVIEFHQSCKEEAQEKFSNPIQIIQQVQLYQGCMDHFISAVCQISMT